MLDIKFIRENKEIVQAGAKKKRIDVDIDKLHLSPGLSASMTGQLDGLSGEQFDARLRRLEGSVLRLERISLETLVMLKKLVAAVSCVTSERVQ